MNKPIIHFAHGNGFVSSSYDKLFQHLSPHFKIQALEMSGHNPQYPVTDNWDHLVEELIENIENTCSEPVIGVGHSLGGILSARASIYRPDLFTAVILLDSPMLGRLKSKMVRLVKGLGLMDRLSPAHRTRLRRQHWPTRELALEYFADKPFFKHFDPDCLQDYVKHGLLPSEHGFTLKFDRNIEYEIYRTLPHVLPRYRKRLHVACTLLYGKDSEIITKSDIKHMHYQYGMRVVEVEGGHMFPFEHPVDTAQAIYNVLY